MLGILKSENESGKIDTDMPTKSQGATSSNMAEDTNKRRPKIGLALGSGVARGWAHIGIIRKLEEAGIVPDMIAGTSIGAVVGAGFASGKLDAIEDWARSLGRTNIFRFLDFKLGGSGLFGSEKLNDLMVERFGDQQFDSLKLPFTAVACELKTSHEVWLNEGQLSDAVRASFAIPGIFEPRKVNGRWLVDGALVNPVPVSVCRAAGCEMVIAVNLAEDIYGRARARREGALQTGEYGVFAEGMSDSSLAARGNRSLLRRVFGHKKDAPSMFANLVASINIMQNRLSRSRLAGNPADVLLTPRCGHIGLMDFNRADELIEEGQRCFEVQLPMIRDALAIIDHRMNL